MKNADAYGCVWIQTADATTRQNYATVFCLMNSDQTTCACSQLHLVLRTKRDAMSKNEVMQKKWGKTGVYGWNVWMDGMCGWMKREVG